MNDNFISKIITEIDRKERRCRTIFLFWTRKRNLSDSRISIRPNLIENLLMIYLFNGNVYLNYSNEGVEAKVFSTSGNYFINIWVKLVVKMNTAFESYIGIKVVVNITFLN